MVSKLSFSKQATFLLSPDIRFSNKDTGIYIKGDYRKTLSNAFGLGSFIIVWIDFTEIMHFDLNIRDIDSKKVKIIYGVG